MARLDVFSVDLSERSDRSTGEILHASPWGVKLTKPFPASKLHLSKVIFFSGSFCVSSFSCEVVVILEYTHVKRKASFMFPLNESPGCSGIID